MKNNNLEYLKAFGLENFKVFKEKTEFEFAPITVLTGTNISDKSSVVLTIRALMRFI